MSRKITSKADVMHMDGMRVGGHDANTNLGTASSTETVTADILQAASAVGIVLDEQSVRAVAEHDARRELMHLLDVNATKYDFKYNFFMHNHGAQLLIAFFRLGADARKLQEAFLAESADYEPAHLSQGRVNEENWQSLIGVDHPPPGPPDFSKPPKPTHYADFQDFFQKQIAEKGAAEVVKMVAPHIAKGVSGDLAHAIIELGYSFELPTPNGQPDPKLLARGLAWMCVGTKALPGLNLSPSKNRAPGGEGRTISNFEPSEMLAQLRDDDRIPRLTTTTGPMGFDQNVGQLVGTPGMPDILGDYDFEIGPDDDPIAAGQKVADAALLAFAASGFKDFFLLHLCTGMRGVQSTLPWVGDAEIQRDMVRAFWKTCVYIYLARGAPDTQNELTRDALSTEGIRSWDEIVAGTLRFKDAHLAKLVFLSRDNFNGIAKGNVAYQVMADKAARVIEAGGDWEQF